MKLAGQIAFPMARDLAKDNEVWGIARFGDPATERTRRLFDGAMFATLYRIAAADAEARRGARAAASTSAAAEAERLGWGAAGYAGGAEEGLSLPLPPWAAEELAAHQRGEFVGDGLLGALAGASRSRGPC